MAANERVHRVVYGSAHMRAPNVVILDIIRVSELRNLSLGCSGLLLYGNQGYLKVIEGSLASLEGLFSSILKDQRHIVIWHDFAGPVRREISAALPMGYFDESELRKIGLNWPSTDTGPADIKNILMNVAAIKYPSAVL